MVAFGCESRPGLGLAGCRPLKATWRIRRVEFSTGFFIHSPVSWACCRFFFVMVSRGGVYILVGFRFGS